MEKIVKTQLHLYKADRARVTTPLALWLYLLNHTATHSHTKLWTQYIDTHKEKHALPG